MVAPARAVFSRRWLPLTASFIALIAAAAFNILAVVGGIPQITAELGQVDLLGWVITGFLVTSTLATVVSGPLIDAFGVRTTLRATLLLFVAGSIGCALAPNMLTLLALRGIQGIGGGMAFAVVTAAVGLMFPEELRSRVLAATSVTWGIMALAGPALGAALVATTGWRGIFLANVPMAGITAILGWTRLPARTGDYAFRGVDVRGLALLGGFTVVSLVGMSSLNLAALFAAGAASVLAIGYWIHSGRSSQPLLSRRHFAQSPLGTINLCFGLAFGAALGIDAYLPVYVRGGLGGTAALAAFSVAFLTVGWTMGSIVTARLLARWSETAVAAVGFCLLLPPLVVGLLVYDDTTPVGLVFSMATIVGIGVGALSMAMLNLLYLTSDPSELGRASAAHQYLRGLFQTYAAALAGTILLLVVRYRIGEVEPIRRLLAGEESNGAMVTAAVAAGFRIAHAVPVGFVSAGALAVLVLHRHVRQGWRRA
ncbi:MAG: MFS transporter [Actinomycetota bacterium]